MIEKRDLVALQIIAVGVIFFTASWPGVRQFLSHVFPYAAVVIPTGAYVLLFQALFFIYTHHLWKLHPHTTYLGGLWIFQAKNLTKSEKKTDDDRTSVDKHSQLSYGVFKVIHTADKLLVKHGRVWDFNELPDYDKKKSQWQSVATIYQDGTLWIIGNVTEEEDSSQARQFEELDVVCEESPIKMEGKIWAFVNRDDVRYGSTEIRKSNKRSLKDATEEAYQKYGSS